MSKTPNDMLASQARMDALGRLATRILHGRGELVQREHKYRRRKG